MSQTSETIYVETTKIACNGDKDSAHPRVYLTLGKNGFVDCPYCGKHYVLKEGAHVGAGH